MRPRNDCETPVIFVRLHSGLCRLSKQALRRRLVYKVPGGALNARKLLVGATNPTITTLDTLMNTYISVMHRSTRPHSPRRHDSALKTQY